MWKNQSASHSVDALLRQVPAYHTHLNRVRNDIYNLMRSCNSLHPKLGTLTLNNGQQSCVVVLGGTVPVYVAGKQYNFPMNIWVVDNYPLQPPLCYVTPTHNMAIKPKHRHVDTSGLCYLPYLNQWNPRRSTLSELISSISQIFSADPPLYAVPTHTQASPKHPSSSQNVAQHVARSQHQQPQRSTPAITPIAVAQPISYSQPPPVVRNDNPSVGVAKAYPYAGTTGSAGVGMSMPSKAYEDPATVARRNAIRILAERTQVGMKELGMLISPQIAEQQRAGEELSHNSQGINSALAALPEEKAKLVARYNALCKQEEEVKEWLLVKENSPGIDPASVVEASTPLSKQSLKAAVDNAVIEDTLYNLDKALQRGEIDLPAFLKNTRNNCRDQFFHRAMLKKIASMEKAI